MNFGITYQKELELVTLSGLNVEFSQYADSIMYKIAVNQNGLALKYINPIHQTDEICISAIKNNYLALKYAHKQTFKMCMLSLYKSDGRSSMIKMIKNPEINVYCEIIKKYPSEMKYVHFNENSTTRESEEQLFATCLRRNGLNIKYIQPQRLTETLCRQAIKNNGLALQHVPINFQNETLCLIALKENVKSIKYILSNLRTTEMWTLALKKNGKLIKYLEISDFDKYNVNSEKIIEIIKTLIHIAITQNKDIISYIISSPICKLLVNLQTKTSILTKNLLIQNNSNNTDSCLYDVESKFKSQLLITDFVLVTNKQTRKKTIEQDGSKLFDIMIDKMKQYLSSKSITKEINNLSNEMTINDYINNAGERSNNSRVEGFHFVKINDNKYELINIHEYDTRINKEDNKYDSDKLWNYDYGIITLNKKFINRKIVKLYCFEVLTSEY